MFVKLTVWLRCQDERVSLTWTQQGFLNVYFPALRTLLNMRNLTAWRKILLSLHSRFSCSFLYHKCHCEQNLWFPFQKGQGAPGREPLISHEEQKQMMLYYYKKQEELKKLEEDDDDSFLNAEWADSHALKRQFHGVKDIKWGPRWSSTNTFLPLSAVWLIRLFAERGVVC